MARDWQDMVRLGGNVFYILKISAISPARMTEIGAHQAGMDHETFLRERLGKKPPSKPVESGTLFEGK